MVKVAVIRFPGSNCDLDVLHVLGNVLGVQADLVWHRNENLGGYDAVVLPGGFSYGDCLRGGVIAAHSPAVSQVKKMAADGKPVLGICNGFQILVESELLPGALLRNDSLKFTCKWTACKVATSRTPFTRLLEPNTIVRMPVAHNEGRFYVEEDDYRRLASRDQVVFKYVSEDGRETPEANPNGSFDNVAGICNEKGNVVGLMPHPERASESILDPNGEGLGLRVFQSMLETLSR